MCRVAHAPPSSAPTASRYGRITFVTRQIAAYRGREKWTVDLVSAEVRYWPNGDDGARTLPPPLGEHEAVEAKHAVFGIFGKDDVLRYAGDGSELDRESLDDVRMKSWGYD